MIIGTEEFLRDEKSRSLIINYKTPHLFGFRLSKYLDKGYIPPESEFIKIIGYTSMEEDPGLIFLGILFSLMDCHSRLKFHLPTYEDAELYVKKLLFFARGCPNWYFNYEFMVNRTFRELKYTYGIEARPRPFLYSDLLF